MKQYNRAKQKRLSLLYVENYTINISNENESDSIRKNKRGAVCISRKDDGKRWNNSSRSWSESRFQELQHQQNFTEKRNCEHRIFDEHGRESGSGIDFEVTAKTLKDAA
jgi:hypothetical protein